MVELAELVVGSTLHGLNTPESDVDTVTIWAEHPQRLISPFYKRVAKVQDDNTRMELSHFMYLCTKGNPTALEVLWSNIVQKTSPTWDNLFKNRHRFLYKDAVYQAHKGYAHAQLERMDRLNDIRTKKARIARLRVLDQGIELLDGTFQPQINGIDLNLLREYKNNPTTLLADKIDETCKRRLDALDYSWGSTQLENNFDIEWFETYMFSLYRGIYLEF